jgi:exonuclease SbcD
MRLLHTSDWHLGRTLHGESLLAHQAAFLEWLLGVAVEQRADAVVVAGDIYDRAVPSTDAVAILDRALCGFADAAIPVLLTSGNHDSAVRLGFASQLSERARIYLCTSLASLTRPLIINDGHGDVGLYGIPYLLPDAVMTDLGAQKRSHESVLAAASARIRADAQGRGLDRVVIAAHAFVTGAVTSESERDIRVGGISDAPASVFAGFSYVALGHLHGQQNVPAPDGTVVRYCGSPLAFSFSEARQHKSVTLADIDAAGQVTVTQLSAPVPRPLREVRGTLGGLLERADGDLKELAEAWVKAVLTDQVRPESPMERLREKWPHTLVLDFAPENGLISADVDLARLAGTTDALEICGMFVEYASGGAPDDAQTAVLRDVTEAVQQAEAMA